MKIICIGRNYTKHIEELQNERPEEPVVFMKPDSAVLLRQHPFVIPEFSEDIHHELEIIVKINKVGKYIDAKFAHKYYDEIGVGIDFTARDLQQKLKDKGLPLPGPDLQRQDHRQTKQQTKQRREIPAPAGMRLPQGAPDPGQQPA